MTFLRKAMAATALCAISAAGLSGQESKAANFNQVFDEVQKGPEFAHALFGIEIYSIDRKTVLFQWNGDKLFTPGSTTKLLTEGTALQVLGPDFRFHTIVYRTGQIDRKGVLKGDLVLVASGDPNLSNRAQADGTLAFSDEDHSYGGFDSKLVPGDPLAALNDIAQQIAAAGIHQVDGRVLIDASLFPEGDRELGTGVAISPVSVNDNVIDAVISPGMTSGAPAVIKLSPQVPYIRFINHMSTGDSGSKFSIDRTETPATDGSLDVTITGTIAMGSHSYVSAYPVENPSRFAAALLCEALEAKGVSVKHKEAPAKPIGNSMEASYIPGNKVAEHVSAPLREEVKVTLKVSQNLHASMTPFLLGAIAGKAKEKIDNRGFQIEHDFLAKAGLDLAGASQSDGAGGAEAAFYTPDFMARYLAYMAAQPDFPAFERALPILGRDGTLFNVQTDSPAAGKVFAKTGTFGAEDLLNGNLMLVGKGLAGYTTTSSGEHVAFAMFVNHVSLPPDPDAITKVAGQALGHIAAAANSLPIEQAR